MGRKEGRIMLHMTRIVGYYAYTAAWNKSKLAELRDRHQGDYSVPEGPFKWSQGARRR
jgi:hypothetical protein